jgi:hypothetical protein
MIASGSIHAKKWGSELECLGDLRRSQRPTVPDGAECRTVAGSGQVEAREQRLEIDHEGGARGGEDRGGAV